MCWEAMQKWEFNDYDMQQKRKSNNLFGHAGRGLWLSYILTLSSQNHFQEPHHNIQQNILS